MSVSRWKCVCGYLMTDEEVETSVVVIDYGDRHTPPESESYCTACGKSHESQEEIIVCSDICENEVTDGYDHCPECIACHREAMFDAMADDGPYGRIS